MEEHAFGGQQQIGRPARPLMNAMARGLRGRCPHCGEGRLFAAYLKHGRSVRPLRRGIAPSSRRRSAGLSGGGDRRPHHRGRIHERRSDEHALHLAASRDLGAAYDRTSACAAAAGQGRSHRAAMGAEYARLRRDEDRSIRSLGAHRGRPCRSAQEERMEGMTRAQVDKAEVEGFRPRRQADAAARCRDPDPARPA